MKLIKLFFIAMLTLGMFASSVSASAHFSDVKESFWAHQEITYLYQQEIIKGYEDNTFRPSNTVTRAQAAIMIAGALELDLENRPAPSFSDIRSDFHAYKVVAAVAYEGIITGRDGRFMPNAPLTRGQMAAILQRAFDLKGHSNNEFNDISKNHAFYKEIQALAANGITTGYQEDNTFRSGNATTRAQFSAFLYRVLHNFNEETPVEEEPVEEEPIEETPIEEVPVEEEPVVEEPIEETPVENNQPLKLNIPYVSKDNNMTVTMQDFTVVDNGSFYEYTITYEETNNTSDQVIDQGSFKIYYTNGKSEPQYGFFNRLFPGESASRSYTFKALKDYELLVVEYGADLFFRQTPEDESLKWGM
ncbi:S-layer homology domain-containing protein [Alkalihalophilus lindianensis]|uniref:S-layer homology domain-containing protein n=1 Tax=Alkalihalophilus lindianensis TaxID=1630542 RepID=A0ABU3XAA7_9BACI|nr:S-layer homology domain-containing protein [Alkalihalophilus lindianensis]MDV2684344.1 S-layer homology domain-containing protein [Alkalihalophilus lindianensis]